MNFRDSLFRNEKIIGTIASTFAILMFFASIEIFISNFQERSNIVIQPLATSLNCFFWCLYSYSRRDWFIAVPNILGLILGIATTIVAFL